MKEAGLIQYWKEHFFLSKFSNYHLNIEDSSEDCEPLTMNQLFYIFRAAFFGIILSFSLFICELFNFCLISLQKLYKTEQENQKLKDYLFRSHWKFTNKITLFNFDK